jgi:Fic family protein
MISDLKPLPPLNFQETNAILKKLALAHRQLAELKGIAVSIPNQSILIDSLVLQEAQYSSAIENIITTQDAMFKQQVLGDSINDLAAKEVGLYSDALNMVSSWSNETTCSQLITSWKFIPGSTQPARVYENCPAPS